MKYTRLTIDTKHLANNSGQLEGVPKNPRQIRDARFDALKKSISEAQGFMEIRELVAVAHGDKYVVIAGNMRLRACRDLGIKQVPVKVVEAPADELRRIATIDNVSFGEWEHDTLANEWDANELADWGVELPSFAGEGVEEYADKNKEVDIDALGTDMVIKLNYTEGDYWQVKEALSKVASTPEQAVFKLLGL